MFLLHKDAKYLDVAEVALLNNVLAAVNLEGNRFFYVNPLEADGKYPFNHGTAGRAPWFGTACCPSNMARLVPQVPGMTYAHDDANLYITFFAESRTKVELNGTLVRVEQKTAYPNDGEISVAINPATPTRFRLHLRMPTWAQDRFVPGELYRYADSITAPITLSVNGKPIKADVEKGFASIDRLWQAGDRVVLYLPMPVRVTECHPAVKANTNRIAARLCCVRKGSTTAAQRSGSSSTRRPTRRTPKLRRPELNPAHSSRPMCLPKQSPSSAKPKLRNSC